MLFFCRQIAKLFHSQLEKAEAPQLFILLISKHGPNVSNVLWWSRDLHRWRREVVIKLASQIKISTSPSACCSLSFTSVFFLALSSLTAFFPCTLSPLLFICIFFLLVTSCIFFIPPFIFISFFALHFCVIFLCLVSSPSLTLPFSSYIVFPFPLLFRFLFWFLSSHLVSLHLISFPFLLPSSL